MSCNTCTQKTKSVVINKCGCNMTNTPCGCRKTALVKPCKCEQYDPCASDCPAPCGGVDRSHVVVQTTKELQRHPNAYVVVREQGNALYHVDGRGNPLVVHRPVIYDNEHVAQQGKFKSTMVFDFINNKMFVYDPEGNVRQVAIGEV